MPVAMTTVASTSSTVAVTKDVTTKTINISWSKSKAEFPHTSCDGHSACSIGSRLFVFGGVIRCEGSEAHESNHLYALDVDTQKWTQVTAKGDIPPARCNATMSAVGSTLYVFGGLSHLTGWFDDLYSFNTESNTWTKLETTGPAPSPRDKLASATIANSIYFFGGFGPQGSFEDDGEWESDEDDDPSDQEAAQFGWFNDLFVFDTVTSTWTQPMQLNLGVPTPRAAHTLSAVGSSLVVCGGRDSVTRVNDVHVYDTESRKWNTEMVVSGDPPLPRSFHSATTIGHDDTRKWNTEMVVSGDPPLPRSFHSATTVGHYVVIIGGRGTQNQHFSDCHLFDTEQKRWMSVSMGGDSPCGRGVHSCHLVGDKLVLFGGSGDFSEELMQCQTFHTDTYTLNTAALLQSIPQKKVTPS